MKMKMYKPMLAKMWDKNSCSFPKYRSMKYDGLRAIFIKGKLLARSLKPIGNIQLRKKYKELLDYSKENDMLFDGEFYSHDLTFQEITSIVNSDDKEVPESLKFHCFDIVVKEEYEKGFDVRFSTMEIILPQFENVIMVEQTIVNNVKEVEEYFETALKEGFEGLILRNPQGKYKLGRSTINEGLLLKVKPFETFDSKVIEIIERNENLNESQTNELGRSFKRNTKDDKKGTGIASALVTEYNGFQFRVTLTGNEEFRKEIWDNKEKYIGKMFEYKAMLVGMKDVPRHPNFIRWREDK